MSDEVGRLLTCDHCGTTRFLKYIGTKEFDGGYTRVSDFEPDDKWKRDTVQEKFVTLCPDCHDAWIQIGIKFLGRELV